MKGGTWKLCCCVFFSCTSLLLRRSSDFTMEITATKTWIASLWSPLLCISKNGIDRWRSCNLVGNYEGNSEVNFLLQPMARLNKSSSFRCSLFSVSYGLRPKLRKCIASLQKELNCSEKFKHHDSVHFVQLLVGVMLIMSVSIDVSWPFSWALTKENHIFP